MKNIIIYIFFIFFTIIFFSKSYAQKKVDSLEKVLHKAKNDKEKLLALEKLARAALYEKPDKAFRYAKKALDLSKERGSKKEQANALKLMSDVYYYHSNFRKALEYDLEVAKVREEIGIDTLTARSYNDIAWDYRNIGNYDKSIKFFFKSLRLYEKAQNKKGVAIVLVGIGETYEAAEDYRNALKYNYEALSAANKANDKFSKAYAYANIGKLFSTKQNFNAALENLYRALKLSREVSEKPLTGSVLKQVADVYRIKKDPYKALEEYHNALTLFEEMNNENGIAECYIGIAKVQTSTGNYASAIYHLEKSLLMSRETGSLELEMKCFDAMYEVYQIQGNYQLALRNYKFYTETRDSLFNLEKNKQMEELQAIYDLEKKDEQIKLQEAEFKRQSQVFYIFIVAAVIAFLLILMIVLLLVRNNRQKQKNNEILQKRRDEIAEQAQNLEQANKVIETKNRNITASINYAQRIQEVVLGGIANIEKSFEQAFVFFRPKDIVSGDFYWYGEVPVSNFVTKKVMIAADCTGHGVPGAFMTLMGHSFLDEIIFGRKIIEPSQILSALDTKIISTMANQNSENQMNDGMDMAVLVFDENNKKVQFAGAKNPLYYVRNGEMNQIKGSKFPVGSFQYGKIKEYETSSLDIQTGDAFYIFSDGFMDQFGGMSNSKFMKKYFRQLLLDISHLPVETQNKKLEDSLVKWKGGNSQTDDILVVGVKY